jgi:hypothetical protein
VSEREQISSENVEEVAQRVDIALLDAAQQLGVGCPLSGHGSVNLRHLHTNKRHQRS